MRAAHALPAPAAAPAGLTFALAASPCSTPILATLLAYVSTTRDPVTGAHRAALCLELRPACPQHYLHSSALSGAVCSAGCSAAFCTPAPTPPRSWPPGGALLFAYTLGYVAPLLGAALFTGALQRILAVRQWSAWVTPASGALLLAGGTYALLSRVFPA